MSSMTSCFIPSSLINPINLLPLKRCFLEFGSWTYDNSQLEVEWWILDNDTTRTPMPFVDFGDYVPSNEWRTDGEEESRTHHLNRTKQVGMQRTEIIEVHRIYDRHISSFIFAQKNRSNLVRNCFVPFARLCRANMVA
ncbi:unnamed protein product [Protopolystoma xenopodis]|uniref:Neurotransmitter-gated ion-channel ligand-binding domain-containing protein n=1 Tax=Protopolystoma xenopodis TaxID=117903 RepID=A0A448WNG4_9PLAT|nr:unnamed protein product [Protopolystoma xenopodis]